MEPFYYTKMTKQQQAAYHVIMQGANALADEFQIPRIESAELYDVFFRLRLDHPEIFWMTGYKYKYYQDSPNLIFVPEYLFDKNKIREHQRAMSSRVEKLARAAKDLSEWEKEKYIHDFICDNVTYDKLKKAYSHEIIGPLGHGVGVCEGIAKSVKVLCDALGIWCMIAVCGNNPEKGIKYPLFHEALCPDMAIIDPTLVVSVPPTITAHTGLDALTHALEAWVSPQATDFTDALAEKAARLVFRALPVAIRQGDCIATRSKMHNASTLAGMAFSQAGLGLNHAIAHQLGGQFHLPHGLANALLLTAVIRFNAGEPRAAKRYARLARACRFCPPEAGEQEAFQALLTAVETLKQQCAIPTLKGALQEKYPLFLSRIPAMVPAALADATLRTNPRPVDGAAIAQLLENLQHHYGEERYRPSSLLRQKALMEKHHEQ